MLMLQMPRLELSDLDCFDFVIENTTQTPCFCKKRPSSLTPLFSANYVFIGRVFNSIRANKDGFYDLLKTQL